MCDAAEDECDFTTDWFLKASKVHTCYACNETIRPGDRYRRSAQKDDTGISTYKHCLRCVAIMKALFKSGVEAVEWTLDCGEIWENPPPEVARLAFVTADEAQKENL